MPPVLPEMDMKKVNYFEIKKHKKDPVDYAELGTRPADAPIVLPPEQSIVYTGVKPTVTPTVSVT